MRCGTRTALALLLTSWPTSAALAQAPEAVAAQPTSEAEELLLDVEINGLAQGAPSVILRSAGRLFANVRDFAAWRILPPEQGRLQISGEDYAPLDLEQGLRAEVDEARQALKLTVEAHRFAATQLQPEPVRTPPSPAVLTGFLNYDVALHDVRRLDAASGYFEGGLSDDWGLLMNTLIADANRDDTDVVRLDTFYLREDPVRLTRLFVGDALTRGAAWAPPVRFGGVRFGSDFGLQPGFVTFPTPTFAGRAALPSQVELFVNDALRFQGEVDAGPFTLNRAPVLTGAGELTVVVRDLLGVERRVTQSYYVSAQLLRRGLQEFSFEAGAEREDYGLRSFAYGEPFIAGSFRRGVRDWLTLETRGELGARVQSVGLGAAAVWPGVAEFGLAGAASTGRNGPGGRLRAYASRITPRWSLSLAYERSTRDFRHLGVSRPQDLVREQLQLSGGLTFGRLGSFTAAYAELRTGEGVRTEAGSLNYGVTWRERLFFNGFALRTVMEGQGAETTVGVGLTIPFGGRSSAYAQIDRRNSTVEYRRRPPSDQGFGYRVAARGGDGAQQQAELTWRGEPLEATLQIAREDGRLDGRLLASGGLMAVAGEVRATRRIEGGVALVEVPGQADVRIYHDNRPVARTNAEGRAVIPTLRSFEPNTLRLELSDVPLGARLEDDTLIVTPRRFGGVRARFGLAQEQGAALLVRLPDGAPLEAGIRVTGPGDELAGFSGYGGEVFVTSAREGMVLDVHRPAGRCRVTIPSWPPQEILPTLGPLTCAPADQ